MYDRGEARGIDDEPLAPLQSVVHLQARIGWVVMVWGFGWPRKVDIRLPGKDNSNYHGARPVKLSR